MWASRFKLLFTLAVRNVFRNPRRSLLTLLAVSIGILSSSLLASIARGLSDQLIEDSINTLTGHVQIHASAYRDDPVVDHRMPPPSDALKQVLAQAPIQKWAARVRVPGVVMSERESAGVTIIGTTQAAELGLSFIGDTAIEGKHIESENSLGIVLGERLVEQLRTKLGRRVVLMSQGVDGSVADRGFRIIGLYRTELEATEKSYAFIGRKTAQTMLGMGEEISEISLRAEDRDLLSNVQRRLRAVVGGFDVADWTVLEPLVTALVKVQSGFLYIWYLIVIVTISFGLVNTLFMSIFERTREIGMYQALGMTERMVLKQILLESFVLLFVGALLGNVLTYLGLIVLQGGIDLADFAQGVEMFGATSMIYPTPKKFDILVVNVFALVIGMLSSLYPAWRAGKLNPAQALTR